MRTRRKKWGKGKKAWAEIRLARCTLSNETCENCGAHVRLEDGEAAHVHPLQRGRSRFNVGLTCSACGTEINTVENVRWTCSGKLRPWCNERVQRPCQR